MKFFLIHGDNTDKSYERLSKFIEAAKMRNWEIVYLDDSSISLKENLASASLFGNTRFYIHRDIKKIAKTDLQFLTKNKDKYDGNVILYSDTLIPKSLINEFPKDIKLEEFKLPVIIWKFLDSIYPGNSKNVIKMLHEILEIDPPEKIIGLIAWHLRDLYWSSVDPESFGSQTWRFGKLKSQAGKFKNNKLEILIEQLAEIDVKSKTSSVNLSESLDFVLLTNLE